VIWGEKKKGFIYPHQGREKDLQQKKSLRGNEWKEEM